MPFLIADFAPKEFFLSLLSSATTKRDSKSYLSRFSSKPKDKRPLSNVVNKETPKLGVNLGSLYSPTRSVMDAPVFRQSATPETRQESAWDENIHVALVKFNDPQLLEDDVVRGVALTLSQLTRLGMASCVVIDPRLNGDVATWRTVADEQADRLLAAIEACDGGVARRLDTALVLKRDSGVLKPKVLSRQMLLNPLRQGTTAIMLPVAYSEENAQARPVPANDVILSLTKELAGLEVPYDQDEDPDVIADRVRKLQSEVLLDRLILLDPYGGIPAFRGTHRSHVFINMEQEYEDIQDELQEQITLQEAKSRERALAARMAASSPLTGFVNSDADIPGPPLHSQNITSPLYEHLNNLRLLRDSLAVLPPSSSGLIATPEDVAKAARPQRETLQVSDVGTRRQKNPLIYNLLTDKPTRSSSLPSSRLGTQDIEQGSPHDRPIVPTTFVKKGMPLTVIPDPRKTPWTPDPTITPRLSLDDPRINIPRLVHLIEDSFNRKLDVQHYLDRISNRLAGLIIAGEYEGGAILTWELPPGVEDDGSPESLARVVPYLDKFAVLKRSQGAGGVADVVFNAMVRTCLPRGVCWRSRIDNPVNKWYFERSRGSWRIPGSNWTMFWTTPGVPEDDPARFSDYEALCRSIQPSWADHNSVPD